MFRLHTCAVEAALRSCNKTCSVAIGSIKVISPTPQQCRKSLPEIARELNVDGIVEGTVQRSGDRVRITAQLLYGPSDKHLWANTYEGIFATYSDLSEKSPKNVARQVQARLTAAERRQLAQPRPVDPTVLEAYLQGNYHLSRYGEGAGQEEQTKAGEYFQQAIAANPNFAPAYVGLASAHKELLLGSSEDVTIRKKSLEKAVELDPNDSDARAWLGWLKWQPLLDWQGEKRNLDEPLRSTPTTLTPTPCWAFYWSPWDA